MVVAGEEIPELVKHPNTRQLVQYAGPRRTFNVEVVNIRPAV